MSVETIAAGRYRVERVLGDGAMATVVLAEDRELGRYVAVKILDEGLAADESFRARFSREARVAAALSHVNVVAVYDVGETNGRPFIVMEHVDGRTLEDRVREEGALPAEDVRVIARQVCAGLEHAHAHGLVHRDLKPGNLIERSDGMVKIADFGIARALESTELTEAGTIVGTAAYLAPEQAEGRPVTAAADMYALGVVLYELAAGRRPWEVRSLADLGRRREETVPELPEHVPVDLRALIERCLVADPEQRPTPAEAAAMLDRDATAGETKTVVMRRPAATARRTRRAAPRRSPLLPALATLVAVLALGAAGLVLLARDDGGAEEPQRAEPAPRRVEPIPPGQTPAEDARNLAEWLRQNSRGGS